jgi:8-oxo-dGTP pyrophosphatase MutT (NUDIX family)
MVRQILFKAAQRLIMQPVHRQIRGMTLGTRTLVIRPGNEILLVRHSYAPGWLLPGGGVERGETIYEAAVREVREEGAIIAKEEPALHGVFLNDRQFPGDHIACFVLRQFAQETFAANLEIAEARFFPASALPADVSGGTKRRIAEVLDGLPAARAW